MKKFILLTLVFACMSFGIANQASAEQKIAVIDIQKVIDGSAQVQALNKEQETKIKELEKWVESAKKDVEKQQTKENKEKLFKKYSETYVKKKQEIITNGQSKMQVILDNISATIQAEAKAKGYDMIITKSVVVYGGDDITADVQNALSIGQPKVQIKTQKDKKK